MPYEFFSSLNCRKVCAMKQKIRIAAQNTKSFAIFLNLSLNFEQKLYKDKQTLSNVRVSFSNFENSLKNNLTDIFLYLLFL